MAPIKAYFPASPELDALRIDAAKNFKAPYNQPDKKEPGAWLVKDDGVYLMLPSPVKNRKPKHVVYAKGYPKGTHVAGDDFADFVPLSSMGKPKAGLLIRITETRLTIQAKA